jgi:hypothetical protein
MYYIQGADQKEYGPVSSDQLRQWISENRLNRFSPARADGESLWKTLGDFPEFADVLGVLPASIAAPPASPSSGSLAQSSQSSLYSLLLIISSQYPPNKYIILPNYIFKLSTVY